MHDAAMIALLLPVIGTGVAFGLQYLGSIEFSELRNVLRRAGERKRVIANNVEVRRAVEALNACQDFQVLCAILKKTLQVIGFDGFRLCCDPPKTLSDAALLMSQRMADGTMRLQGDDIENNEPLWELRLELNTERCDRLGHFSLLRTGCENPLLVDFNLLSREFRIALSNAVLRAMNGHRSPALLASPGPGAATAKVAAAVNSDEATACQLRPSHQRGSR